MIRDCHLDDVEELINEKNFPSDKDTYGEKHLALFRFHDSPSMDVVCQNMDNEGYRPSTIPEGLTLIKHRADLLDRFPVLIPGSPAVHDTIGSSGGGVAQVFRKTALRRTLTLVYRNGGWGSPYRILGVKK
jgi:hypothetical protein